MFYKMILHMHEKREHFEYRQKSYSFFKNLEKFIKNLIFVAKGKSVIGIISFVRIFYVLPGN